MPVGASPSAGAVRVVVVVYLLSRPSGGRLRFLVDILGFGEVVAVSDEPGKVVHAELSWPGGGSLVFGSTKHEDSVHGAMKPGGTSAVHFLTDDVDAACERVRHAEGGTVVQPPGTTQFRSGADAYAFAAADPEATCGPSAAIAPTHSPPFWLIHPRVESCR